jgi:hypothetical protein
VLWAWACVWEAQRCSALARVPPPHHATPAPPLPLPSRVQELWYPNLNATDSFGDMEARLRAFLAGKPPPFFVLVYGDLLNADGTTIVDVAAEMQQRLGGGGDGLPPLRTLGMQDMVDLATQEGALRRR